MLDVELTASESTIALGSQGDFLAHVDAMLLDAAGTLIQPREPVGQTYAAVAQRFGMTLDPGSLSRVFAEVFGNMPDLAFEWSSLDDLQRQERGWWRALVRRVVGSISAGCGDFDSFFEALYDHYAHGCAWACFPEVLPTLNALRSKGCKLAVVSNFDSRLPRILQDLRISDRLHAVVYSSRVGSSKPDPAIFRYALAVLGVRPERAIHVGDNLRADVGGAAAAGVGGVLIRRGCSPASPSGEVMVIRSIEALLARV